MNKQALVDVGFDVSLLDNFPSCVNARAVFRVAPASRRKSNGSYGLALPVHPSKAFLSDQFFRHAKYISTSEFGHVIVKNRFGTICEVQERSNGGFEIRQEINWPESLKASFGLGPDDNCVRIDEGRFTHDDELVQSCFAHLEMVDEDTIENKTLINLEDFSVGLPTYELRMECLSFNKVDWRRAHTFSIDGSDPDFESLRFVDLVADSNSLPNLTEGSGSLTFTYNPDMKYNYIKFVVIEKVGSNASKTSFTSNIIKL